MGDASIPLSKSYNPKRLNFPVYVSEKLDGVPVRISLDFDNHEVVSRQWKEVPSVANDVSDFIADASAILTRGRYRFVAEVTHRTAKGFKDVSGIVRRQEAQDDLILNFFEYVNWNENEESFYIRHRQLKDLFFFIQDKDKFRVIEQKPILDQKELDYFLHENPIRVGQEGWVIRSHDAVWSPGSRKWDYQKFLVTPTADLPLLRVDEAIDKEGKPNGMAGKLWVEYKGKAIGCGPGALTHPERIKLLQDYRTATVWNNPTIEVAYKTDPTYDALREARFVAFRPDKD